MCGHLDTSTCRHFPASCRSSLTPHYTASPALPIPPSLCKRRCNGLHHCPYFPLKFPVISRRRFPPVVITKPPTQPPSAPLIKTTSTAHRPYRLPIPLTSFGRTSLSFQRYPPPHSPFYSFQYGRKWRRGTLDRGSTAFY